MVTLIGLFGIGNRDLASQALPFGALAGFGRLADLLCQELVDGGIAHTGDPVSRFWMNRLFRRLPVTAAQLRDDRIIEEALAGRPDPLHLAAVFGFGPRTGLRYAQAAFNTADGGSRQDLSDDTGGGGPG